jgi:hypothetical protein
MCGFIKVKDNRHYFDQKEIKQGLYVKRSEVKYLNDSNKGRIYRFFFCAHMKIKLRESPAGFYAFFLYLVEFCSDNKYRVAFV